MKKLTKAFALMLMCLGFAVLFTGCEAKLKSLELKNGTINLDYLVGDEVDLSAAIVVAKYSDKTSVDLNARDLTFSKVDTSTAGTKDLVITYQDKSFVVKVNVYTSLDQVYDITGFETPQFVVENNAAKSIMSGEAAFTNRTKPYYVGDDNEFVFLPNITAMTNNRTTISLNRYKSFVKVYVWDEDQEPAAWVKIVDNNPATAGANLLNSNLVAINNITSTFDFAEGAIDKKFKIEVRPQLLSEEQNNSEHEDYIENQTFEFIVVDGYNVHTVEQLSVFDNSSKSVSVWASYKAKHGLTGVDADAIIIHGDKDITTKDLPAAYFYTADDAMPSGLNAEQKKNAIGTMKTWISMYNRETATDETFKLYGNYFTINAGGNSAKNIPAVPKCSEDIVVAYDRTEGHTRLFDIGGTNNYSAEVKQGTVYFYDINVVGNAARSSTISNKLGLSFFETKANSFYEDNVNQRNFHTTLILTNRDMVATFNDSKSYDSFSSMIYTWPCNQVIMTGCEFKRAGGPLIMLCHVYPERAEDPNKGYSNLTATDCVLESWVTGQEGWFSLYPGASTAVGDFVKLGQGVTALTGNTKTISRLVEGTTDVYEVNLICLIMDQGNPLAAPGKIQGTAIINANEDNVAKCDMYTDAPSAYVGGDNPLDIARNTFFGGMVTTVLEAIDAGNGGAGKAAPVFQSSNGGMMYFNGTTFINPIVNGMFSPNGYPANDEAAQNAARFAKGDYMYIYAPAGANGRLAAVLDYLTIAEA